MCVCVCDRERGGGGERRGERENVMGNLEILYQAALYGMGNMQINKKNYFLKQILNFYQLTLKQGHMFTLTLSLPKKLKNSTLKIPM